MITLSVFTWLVLLRACFAEVPEARLAQVGEAPYSVVVLTHSVCSGVLVSYEYVLTAAHCVTTNSSLSTATVIAGTLNTSLTENHNDSTVQVLVSDYVFVHPSHNNTWAQHDIAIIKVKGSFNSSVAVSPIPVANKSWTPHSSHLCTVPGYGRAQIGVASKHDYHLKIHSLNITKPCPCETQLIREKGFNRVQSWLCSDLRPHSGPCSGDSGAPLVCDGVLWGLTSSTFYIHDPSTCDVSKEPEYPHCGTPHELNIFMDLYPYSAWTQQFLTSSCYKSVKIYKTVALFSFLYHVLVYLLYNDVGLK